MEGLLIALDFIDEVIEILRSSKDQPEGRERLMQRFGLDEPQAQAIVQMRLGQLTGLERHKIEEEMAQLKEKIAEYMEILSSETRVLEIVKEEALVLRDKYGDDRLIIKIFQFRLIIRESILIQRYFYFLYGIFPNKMLGKPFKLLIRSFNLRVYRPNIYLCCFCSVMLPCIFYSKPDLNRQVSAFFIIIRFIWQNMMS